jgi:hypothetical protein
MTRFDGEVLFIFEKKYTAIPVIPHGERALAGV